MTTFDLSGSLVIIRIRGLVRVFTNWSRYAVIFSFVDSPVWRVLFPNEIFSPPVNIWSDEMVSGVRPVLEICISSFRFDFPSKVISTCSFDRYIFGTSASVWQTWS